MENNLFIEYPKCSTCQKAKKWLNENGIKYKELNLKEKLPNMSDNEKIKLLASDGMLVKRPMLINDEVVLLGFKEKEWEVLK